MNDRSRWSRRLLIVGSLAMPVGAIDPLEGSGLILLGSAALLAGTLVSREERRWIAYRTWAFVLVAAGVAALWGLSSVGGFGGPSGRSIWWGMLILPYPVGWSLGVWGPGAPRLGLWLGLGVGLWYLVLSGMIWSGADGTNAVSLVIGAVGAVTLTGCLVRLGRRPA